MLSPLAQQTIKRVTERLESGEAAGLSEIVELIQRLSTNAYETSVQELALLISKDVVVTARVIASANTIGYNPAGVSVTTISEAIQVIGFNKIRQLTVSLLLMENADRTLKPTEKREIAALALCSGLMAEAVMHQRGTASPEQAFICASLRNYGRLLMTSFMIEDYRRARIMAAEGETEDNAFESVFGLTPLDLGYHLLSSAHLPDPILKSLRALPPGMIRSAIKNTDLEILALSDLCVNVCELALRSDLGAMEFDKRTQAIAARTGRLFDLTADCMINVLRETAMQLNEFATSFGLTALSEQFAPRLEARVLGNNPAGYRARPVATSEAAEDASDGVAPLGKKGGKPQPDATSLSSSLLSPVQDASAKTERHSADTRTTASAPDSASAAEAASPAASAETVFQNAFQQGIEQIAGLLEEDPVDMRKIYGVILRSALLGFGTSEGAVFVRDSSTRRFHPQYGNGVAFSNFRATALGREGDRDVFGLCLQRLEDVLIYDARDPKILPHLPSWIRNSTLNSFVLLPIQENRRPFAVLLAAWPEKRTAGFTVAQIRHVRSMLKLAGTARKLADVR